MAEFQVGDTVQLKSGGPNMMVERIGSSTGPNSALCRWFEGEKLHDQWFQMATLKKVD